MKFTSKEGIHFLFPLAPSLYQLIYLLRRSTMNDSISQHSGGLLPMHFFYKKSREFRYACANLFYAKSYWMNFPPTFFNQWKKTKTWSFRDFSADFNCFLQDFRLFISYSIEIFLCALFRLKIYD